MDADEKFERVAVDRVVELERELRHERRETMRAIEVASAASEFVDNNRRSTNVGLMVASDIERLYAKVEEWRLENERQLAKRGTR